MALPVRSTVIPLVAQETSAPGYRQGTDGHRSMWAFRRCQKWLGVHWPGPFRTCKQKFVISAKLKFLLLHFLGKCNSSFATTV